MPSQIFSNVTTAFNVIQISVDAPVEIYFAIWGANGGNGGSATAAAGESVSTYSGRSGGYGYQIDGNVLVRPNLPLYIALGTRGQDGISSASGPNLGGGSGGFSFNGYSGGSGASPSTLAGAGGGGGGATLLFRYAAGSTPGSFAFSPLAIAAGGGGGGGAGRYGAGAAIKAPSYITGSSNTVGRGGSGQASPVSGIGFGSGGGGGGGERGGWGGTISSKLGGGGLDGSPGLSGAPGAGSIGGFTVTNVNSEEFTLAPEADNPYSSNGNGAAFLEWSRLEKINVRDVTSWIKPSLIKYRDDNQWKDVTKVYYRVDNTWRQIYGNFSLNTSEATVDWNNNSNPPPTFDGPALPDETFTVSKTSLEPGESFTLSGAGGQRNTEVTIKYTESDKQTVTLNSNGAFGPITKTLPAGEYVIRAVYAYTGNERTRTVSVVAPPPPPDPPPPPPVADFNYTITPISAEAPATVKFVSTSSGDPTGYRWNFDVAQNVPYDYGTDSYEKDPTHVYTRPDTYVVRLRAINASGDDEIEKTIEIIPPFDEKVTIPATTDTASTFTLNVTGARPASYFSYAWYDSNGNAVTPTAGAPVSNANTNVYGGFAQTGIKFATPGTYEVRVTFPYNGKVVKKSIVVSQFVEVPVVVNYTPNITTTLFDAGSIRLYYIVNSFAASVNTFTVTVNSLRPNSSVTIKIYDAKDNLKFEDSGTANSSGSWTSSSVATINEFGTHTVKADVVTSTSTISTGTTESRGIVSSQFLATHQESVIGPLRSNTDSITFNPKEEELFYFKIIGGRPNSTFDYQYFKGTDANATPATEKLQLTLDSNGNFLNGSGGSLGTSGTYSLRVFFNGTNNNVSINVNVLAKDVVITYDPSLNASANSILVGGTVSYQVVKARPNSSLTFLVKRKSDSAVVYGPITATADSAGQWSSNVLTFDEYGEFTAVANVQYDSNGQTKDVSKDLSTVYDEIVTGPFESNSATSTFTPIEDQFFFIKISGGRPNTAFTYRYWQGDTAVTEAATGILDSSGNFNTGSGGSLGTAGTYTLKVNFDGSKNDRALSVSVNAKPVVIVYDAVVNVSPSSILVGNAFFYQVKGAPNSSASVVIRRKSDQATVYGSVSVTLDSNGQFSSGAIQLTDYGTHVVSATIVHKSNGETIIVTKEVTTNYDEIVTGPFSSNDATSEFTPIEDQTFFVKISSGRPNTTFSFQYFRPDGSAATEKISGLILDSSGNFNTGSGGSFGVADNYTLKVEFDGTGNTRTRAITINPKPVVIVYSPILNATATSITVGETSAYQVKNAKPSSSITFGVTRFDTSHAYGPITVTADADGQWSSDSLVFNEYGVFEVYAFVAYNSNGETTRLARALKTNYNEFISGPFSSNSATSTFTPIQDQKFFIKLSGGRPNTDFTYQYFLNGVAVTNVGQDTLDSSGNFNTGSGGSLGNVGTHVVKVNFLGTNNERTLPFYVDAKPEPPPPPPVIVYPTPTVEILDENGNVVAETSFVSDGVTYYTTVFTGSSSKFKFRVTGGYENSAFSYSALTIEVSAGGGEITAPISGISVIEVLAGSGNLSNGSYTSSLLTTPYTWLSLVLKFAGNKEVVRSLLTYEPQVTVYTPTVSIPVDGNGNLHVGVNTNTQFKYKITGGKPSTSFDYYLYYIGGPETNEGGAYYYSSLVTYSQNLSLNSSGNYDVSSQSFNTLGYVGRYQAEFRFVDGIKVFSPEFSVSVPPLVAPTVAFSTSYDESRYAPLSVSFTNNTTGTVTSYSWNFGDGTSSSVASPPAKTYSSSGTYNITLTAYNGGLSNSNTTSITVVDAPVTGSAPTASFTLDKNSGTYPLTVTATDTSTGTPGITSRSWSVQDLSGSSTYTDSVISHTFSNPGAYSITLTVDNGIGNTSTSSTVTVNVPDPAPAPVSDPVSDPAPAPTYAELSASFNSSSYTIGTSEADSDTLSGTIYGIPNSRVKRSYYHNGATESFNSLTTTLDSNGQLYGEANVWYLKGVGSYELRVVELDTPSRTISAYFSVVAEPIVSTCLAYGTKITMANGSTQNIEKLYKGQKVKTVSIEGLSLEEDAWKTWTSDAFSVKPATATINSVVHGSFANYYMINGGLLTITYEHPLLVKRNNLYSFKQVKDLVVGDMLYSQDKKWISVDSIHFVNEPLKVVFLSVEDEDTYFANGVLTHNAPAKQIDSNVEQSDR